MTVDEYYASRKEVTLFGAGKGEKKLENEFEGMTARVANLEEDFLKLGSDKSLRKKNKNKNVEKVEVNFRFKKEGSGFGRDRDNEDRTRRGGGRGDRRRGDRRGGQGGRGRRSGGGQGGRGSSLAIDDSNAFPSL